MNIDPHQTTDDAFEQFDEDLLDSTERLRAIEVHNRITELLIDKRLIAGAFLQGSFARKTMIAPLRDIDKVVLLHRDLSGSSPDQVMDLLQAVLEAEYPDVTFERSRHSLKMDFGEDSFSFDIVPAWESDGDDDDDVLIADRETGGWKRSNTRELIRVVSERNQGTDGLFIHQVRMGKQVIKHLLDGAIPGLHVESWAYMTVAEKLPHDEALSRILDAAALHLGGHYTDPTGSDVISDRLDTAVVGTARPVLERAAERAREARELTASGDHTEAIRIWHDLCGDLFPQAPVQNAETALRRSFEGGSMTSSGTVSTSRRDPDSSIPTRSWRAS